LFLRVKQHNISSEVVGLYDTIARLVSLALQYNVPVEAIGKKLLRTRMLPAGPVVGDARIKSCESTLDYVGRKLLVDCCGRDDLAQVPKYPEASP
jgi:ribonucleoside-diphosphate reductase alpha chain